MVKDVHDLIAKSAKAATADEAMKYSQAACNAANALRVLTDNVKAEGGAVGKD